MLRLCRQCRSLRISTNVYNILSFRTGRPSIHRLCYSTTKIPPASPISKEQNEQNVAINPAKEKQKTSNKISSPKRYSKEFIIECKKKLGKQKWTANNLKTYLQACCASNLTKHGWNLLQERKANGEFRQAYLYNTILHGFVREHNWTKIQEVLSTLKQNNIAFTTQTYVLALEFLGKQKPSEKNVHEIQMLIKEGESQNISIDRILNEISFVRDQREIVLNAIRRVDSTYQPNYIPPLLQYNNKLVESLNKDVVAIGENPIKPESAGRPCSLNAGPIPVSSSVSIDEMMKCQLDVEVKGRFAVKNVAITPPARAETAAVARQKLDALLIDWRAQIAKSLQNHLSQLEQNSTKSGLDSITIYPYLRVLSYLRLTDFLIDEIIYLNQNWIPYAQSTMQLYTDLGRRVMKEYQVETKFQNGLVDKMLEIYPKYCETLLKGETWDNPRQIWQRLEYDGRRSGASLGHGEPVWPFALLYDIGKFLYKMLYKDLKIDANINRMDVQSKRRNMRQVFSPIKKGFGHYTREEVHIHSAFSNLFRSAELDTVIFDSMTMPMLSPPVPWINTETGCYLIRTSNIIRPRKAIESTAVDEYIHSVPPSHIYPTLDALSSLGSVAWKINCRILDIIIDVLNSGGNEELKVPPISNSFTEENFFMSTQEAHYKNDKSQICRKLHELQVEQENMYNYWCYILYQLSMANYLRDRPFWQPQGIDFRGRVHPFARHFNHVGADLCRSLFLFYEARPLGQDGLQWLKLHCINLSGLKSKNSLTERLQFAEEIFDEIIDSADNPLSGRMWWTKCDKPWQTLACCMEIANATRSPDPTTYMSHFPIQQDGSSNGLQHYAALGRDESEAISVNLVNSSAPHDIYAEVAHKVEKMRQNDATNGVVIAQNLDGYITRKLVKKAVMTAVYGVTEYGARSFFEKDLKENKTFPKEDIAQATSYLTTSTFESLQSMTISAREIQNWLMECAQQICTVRAQNVAWVTPLGLPVELPHVGDGNLRKSLSSFGPISMRVLKPDVNKQKLGFPANFIHSLDASHMMMTALHCEKSNITFASIHDCFWTHAATVNEMNKICREQFVLLHSEPILANLSRSFIEKYGFNVEELTGDDSDKSKIALNKILSACPQPGKFQLDNVLDSVYFFS